MDNVNEQPQGSENLDTSGEGLNKGEANVGLPSEKEPELSVEEKIAKLEKERDQARKDHSELEKLLGRKGDEEGKRKQAERESAAQRELEQSKASFYEETLSDFIKNGMKIDEDISAKLEELNIPEYEYKVKAYEYRENKEQLYATAGSKEAYEEIVNWGKDNVQLTKEQLVIEGMKALYINEIKKDSAPTKRVEGDVSAIPKSRGYQSKREISEDLAYIRANPNDRGAFDMYRKKLSLTANGIL